jgi:hypothetical protein
MAVGGRRQIDVTFFPNEALCPPCRQPNTKYFSSPYIICNSFVPIAQKAGQADVLGRLSLSMCLWNQHKMAAQLKEKHLGKEGTYSVTQNRKNSCLIRLTFNAQLFGLSTVSYIFCGAGSPASTKHHYSHFKD